MDVSWGSGNAYPTVTIDDRIRALVDMEGNILGLKIDGISAVKGQTA